jgi:hypothetical protein
MEEFKDGELERQHMIHQRTFSLDLGEDEATHTRVLELEALVTRSKEEAGKMYMLLCHT